jgi:hypothetical protein
VDVKADGSNFTKSVDDQAKALADVREAADQAAKDQAWGTLSDTLWKFDAQIQDKLTAFSDTQACGYQLGRGLAESYWALYPGAPLGSTSWTFLLGRDRCAELGRLVGRLTAYEPVHGRGGGGITAGLAGRRS